MSGAASSGQPAEPAIRTGRVADIPALLELWRAAETLPTATDSPQGLEELLEHDPEAVLVVCLGDEVIASVIAGWDGWRGSFYRLAVHPDWRRQGIAMALIRAGEERLRAAGAIRLQAIVASDDEAAMGIWQAAGYEDQAERSRFVRLLKP